MNPIDKYYKVRQDNENVAFLLKYAVQDYNYRLCGFSGHFNIGEKTTKELEKLINHYTKTALFGYTREIMLRAAELAEEDIKAAREDAEKYIRNNYKEFKDVIDKFKKEKADE